MVRKFTPTDGFVPVDLLRNAIDHLGAAEKLFKSSPSYFDSGGYLMHLAVELFLKAWLLQDSKQFPGSHNLTELHGDLVKSSRAPTLSDEQARTLLLLDRYSELRYPNRNDPVEVGTDDLSAVRNLMLPGELLLELSRVDVLKKGGRVLMKKRIQDV